LHLESKLLEARNKRFVGLPVTGEPIFRALGHDALNGLAQSLQHVEWTVWANSRPGSKEFPYVATGICWIISSGSRAEMA